MVESDSLEGNEVLHNLTFDMTGEDLNCLTLVFEERKFDFFGETMWGKEGEALKHVLKSVFFGNKATFHNMRDLFAKLL